MSLFSNDFEIKKCLVDMLDKVTFGQAEAITTALKKWEELEKLKKEMEKQIPKKPVINKEGCLVCGNCGSYDGIRTETNFIEGYCWKCGQKIDIDDPTEKGR